MRIGGRTSVSQITRHNEFGGAARGDYTRNNMPYPISTSAGVYRIEGTGRDTYIGWNNGNNFASYEPTKHEGKGTFDYGMKNPAKKFQKTHAHV